jgi:hypothetical protein
MAAGENGKMTRPIFHTVPEFKELNASLRPLILANRETSKGIEATNIGGWHSDYFDGDACKEAPVRRLVSTIKKLAPVDTWNIPMLWANVNEKGHYNKLHTHGPAGLWSGYYVVDDGLNGLVEYIPGEDGRTVFPSIDLAVAPRNGLLAFFPADLKHSVELYQGGEGGDGLRITVAFNMKPARVGR